MPSMPCLLNESVSINDPSSRVNDPARRLRHNAHLSSEKSAAYANGLYDQRAVNTAPMEGKMKHLKLAVLEARWANRTEWSVRPYYETLASIFCDNPNGYHYEMFNNAASLKESLPGVAGTQGIKNIVIASHGDERGIVGARDNEISRAVLANAIFQIEKNIEGIFFAGCEVGHAQNAKFLFHDFGDPGGIRLQWLAGYNKRVDWLRAAAFELLFWTVYFQELGKGGGPIVRI
jgi:hypothetical protein